MPSVGIVSSSFFIVLLVCFASVHSVTALLIVFSMLQEVTVFSSSFVLLFDSQKTDRVLLVGAGLVLRFLFCLGLCPHPLSADVLIIVCWPCLKCFLASLFVCLCVSLCACSCSGVCVCGACYLNLICERDLPCWYSIVGSRTWL